MKSTLPSTKGNCQRAPRVGILRAWENDNLQLPCGRNDVEPISVPLCLPNSQQITLGQLFQWWFQTQPISPPQIGALGPDGIQE